MTQDEIIKMAEKADAEADNVLNIKGEHHPNWHEVRDEIFAKLVERRILSMDKPHLRNAFDAAQDKARKDEREACVELRNMFHPIDGHGRKEMIDVMNRGLDEYQAAIRARSGEQA